ncbi:three-Cys-motif partner protein TcmP [Kitasatospora sp. NPDC088548]|uniref:three-Cys-motif partner protein TcmP n=1 Tax=Kitasatospora sp. NPDC088548 TaxID=3364075 RepID=UPI0038127463
MSKGTSGEYWSEPELPSVFKHALLSRYMPKFGGMTGAYGRRVTYLDGYAGEGRYENGEPGSAARILQIAADLQAKAGIHWTCFFAEKSAPSFAQLGSLVAEYQARGVDARAFRGDVLGYFDEVLAAATGQPLFLFLDPCGLALPFERLVDVLAKGRPGLKPPTEFLLNFSMMAIRRIGGNSQSPKGIERTNQRLDEVCGGPWWRDFFAGGYTREADEKVAAEYSARLGKAVGMQMRSVPVTKAPGHKAVYNLVFGTRRQHGLWAFGDAHARARDTWWQQLELQEEATDDGLFPVVSLQRPDPQKVRDLAVPAMADNLARLLRRGRTIRLVDHTLEVFGEYYGQVTETAARDAIKLLHRRGGTPSDGMSHQREKVYDLLVRPLLTR